MKKRIEWIDMTRCFAIYLVVLGHTIQFIFPREQFIFRLIYSFHMPLFFILCGYTFQFKKNQAFLDFIKKKIISYGKPYLIFVSFDLIEIFLKFLNNGIYVIDKRTLISTLFMTYESLFSELWFFPCLFTAEIILYIIYKYIYTKRMRFITVLIICCCGYFVNSIGIILPLQLDVAMFVQMFIFVGIEAKTSKYHVGITSKLILLTLFFLINIYIFFTGGKVDGLYKLDIYNPILFIITGLTGAISSIEFIKSVSSVYIKLFLDIGRHSAYIYGLHFYILKIVSKIINSIHFDLVNTNIFFSLLLSVIIIIITEFIIKIVYILPILNKRN